MRTLLTRLQARAAEDHGISLVEVLVSLTVLAVTMTAVATSVVASLQVARDSRETVVAANIAQFELERLRAIPFLEWVQSANDDGDTELTRVGEFQTADGVAYEISRAATWVSSGADTDGCDTAQSGAGTGADYILVRQVITFPGRDLAPVENQTIVTPRLDFFDPYQGNLAVIVRDRGGVGVPNIQVRISGLGGSDVTRTDANGCAFFAFLSIDSDVPANNGYDIVIDTDGYIDRATGLQEIDEVAYVAAQTTTVVEYEYDRGVQYALSPSTAVPDSDPAPGSYIPYACTVTLVQLAPQDYALECRDGATNVVPTWRPLIPDDLGWTLYNDNYNALGYFNPPLVDSLVLPNELESLYYPYNAGYGAQAGVCQGAKPDTAGDLQVLTAEPGSDVVAQVLLTYTVVTSQEVAAQDVYADMVADTGCASGQRLYLGQVDAVTPLQTVLPFGEWTIQQVPAGSPPSATILDCASYPSSCLDIVSATAEGVGFDLGLGGP